MKVNDRSEVVKDHVDQQRKTDHLDRAVLAFKVMLLIRGNHLHKTAGHRQGQLGLHHHGGAGQDEPGHEQEEVRGPDEETRH